MSAIINNLKKHCYLKTNGLFKPINLVIELSLQIAEIKSLGFVTDTVFPFNASTGYFLLHFQIW